MVILVGCGNAHIDACLDHGGSYNYEKCKCDYENNHDYKDIHQCSVPDGSIAPRSYGLFLAREILTEIAQEARDAGSIA